MTIPSFLNEKTIKVLTNAGAAVIGLIILGFLLYNQMAYQTTKLEAMGPAIQSLTIGQEKIMTEHHEIKTDLSTLKDELLDEAKKQTTLQQKICVRQSKTVSQANDCLSL